MAQPKPWTVESFIADQRRQGPIYVRRKGMLGLGSLVQSISPEGVNVFYAKDGHAMIQGITWLELLLSCEQIDGSLCGRQS